MDQGFVVLTALNGASEEEVQTWAEQYSVTHPVLADTNSAAYTLAGDGTGYWPYRILIDRGMIIDTADSGMDSTTIEPLL